MVNRFARRLGRRSRPDHASRSMTDEPAVACHATRGSDLAVAAGQWLDHLVLERGHSALTREAYARDLQQFSGFLTRTLGRPAELADLARLDARAFRGFMASRRAQGAIRRIGGQRLRLDIAWSPP